MPHEDASALLREPGPMVLTVHGAVFAVGAWRTPVMRKRNEIRMRVFDMKWDAVTARVRTSAWGGGLAGEGRALVDRSANI